MRALKKIAFALLAAVALGGVGASTASAVTFLVSASSPRAVRSEGLTEATGVVALTSSSGGTIAAGSTLTLDYGTPLVAGTGTVASSCSSSPTASYSGNVLTLSFAVDTACLAGNSIRVSGVRVNANALAPGANINVSVGATSTNQVANPITFLQFAALTVAKVQAKATTVAFTDGVILLCNPPLSVATAAKVRFTVTENFPQAFLSKKDEQGLNDNGFVQDFKIRFSFRNIPLGLRMESVDTTGSDASLATLTASGLPFTSRPGSQDVNVEIVIDDDDSGTNTTGEPEKLVAEFLFWVPDRTALTTTDQTGTVKIELSGGGSAPEVPRFAASPVFLYPESVPGAPPPGSSPTPDPAPTPAPSPAPPTGPPKELSVLEATFSSSADGPAIVAPGMLASAFAVPGSATLTGVSQNFYANSLPLPKTLGGTTVRLGGSLTLDNTSRWNYSPVGSQEAPLLFVGPGQVNFQVPPGLALGDVVPVQLQKADGTTLLSTVRVLAAIPRIFTFLFDGHRQAAILNQDNSQNGSPESIPGARPAPRGSVIQIFATGAGDTDPPLLPGEAAPANGNPLVFTRVQPTVIIRGIPARVWYSVMAPGYPGIWQIGAEVPADIAPGSAIPLSMKAGAFESNTVTIAVE